MYAGNVRHNLCTACCLLYLSTYTAYLRVLLLQLKKVYRFIFYEQFNKQSVITPGRSHDDLTCQSKQMLSRFRMQLMWIGICWKNKREAEHTNVYSLIRNKKNNLFSEVYLYLCHKWPWICSTCSQTLSGLFFIHNLSRGLLNYSLSLSGY